MRGFLFHHFRRFKITGLGLGAMRARSAMKRRVNRRVLQSLRASQVAVAEMEEQNRMIKEEMEQISVANTLADQWVNDGLSEVENDPLMIIAFQRINSQNLDAGNTINMDGARSFTGRRRRP